MPHDEAPPRPRDRAPRERGSVLSFYLPASMADRLIREAADTRMTVSGYVRQILVTRVPPRNPNP